MTVAHAQQEAWTLAAMHALGNRAGHGITIHMFTHIHIHIHKNTYIYCFSYSDVLKPYFSIIHAQTYIYICIHTYTYIYINILTSSWAGRPGNSLMTGCLPIFLQIEWVGGDQALTHTASDIRLRLQSSSPASRSFTQSESLLADLPRTRKLHGPV